MRDFFCIKRIISYICRTFYTMKSFIEELRWRGMLQDHTEGIDQLLSQGTKTAYIGFDPTADSLHVGNLLAIMLLVHFQRAGHKPIALVGGATGRVGDPSGKSQERNMLSEEILAHNLKGIEKQLRHFLDFENPTHGAEILNNYDWTAPLSFLDFIRDIGKHISVNYMMAKDSVKKRIETGISFTEFSYQLLQGFDFYHLYKNKNCVLQMGGSDQWGNITTGIELIRRKLQGEAHALTAPLITKSDGTKFGKSESGAIWLDASKTSPYSFYQFWLNTSDEDAARFIKVFTLLDQETVESLIANHQAEPHLRTLQKRLAEEVTLMVHGKKALDNAQKATQILFGNATHEEVLQLTEETLVQIAQEVPFKSLEKSKVLGVSVIDVLHEAGFLASKSEARRELKANAIAINKEKIGEDYIMQEKNLLKNRYILFQKGKKQYFLLEMV